MSSSHVGALTSKQLDDAMTAVAHMGVRTADLVAATEFISAALRHDQLMAEQWRDVHVDYAAHGDFARLARFGMQG